MCTCGWVGRWCVLNQSCATRRTHNDYETARELLLYMRRAARTSMFTIHTQTLLRLTLPRRCRSRLCPCTSETQLGSRGRVSPEVPLHYTRCRSWRCRRSSHPPHTQLCPNLGLCTAHTGRYPILRTPSPRRTPRLGTISHGKSPRSGRQHPGVLPASTPRQRRSTPCDYLLGGQPLRRLSD